MRGMRSSPAAFIVALALVAFPLGCGLGGADEHGASEDAIQAFTAPGANLGRATHIIADDVAGDATFVVFNRTLERRSVDGKVGALGRIDAGFEHLVVGNKLAAYVTASFVNGGGSKVVVHVLERASGWKEVRTEDLSTAKATFRHPLVGIGEDTFAVGSGEEVVILAPDGTKSSVGGKDSRFGGKSVFSLHPSGARAHLYAALDNGDVFDIDTGTKELTLQPSREERATPTLEVLFDARTKTWVSTDFEGIKVHATDGKLLRKVNLETERGRFITTAALRPDGKLVVAHASESSQERSVLAVYDLGSLARTELGTFDGILDQLGPASERLFFAFSPRGAAGFSSRVWFAHALAK
jgi:hypothetical protein